MIPVESSAIIAVDYDPGAGVLTVQFTGMAIYEYADVPKIVFQELMAAESKGTYFALYIRDEYEYRRVR
ncbi:MAG: KTSC domain-containing protein [Hyphomicrobiaceae bacterium]|nr:KTSC domain-containing protein [Hyphomicrobiaceae bacterium]